MDCKIMEQYQKRVLLSVTGMSPAVVTETLYALVTEKQFVPTEIRVITTLQGKNKVLQALLGIEGGRKEKRGALEEFVQDYGEKYGFDHIHFDENCIEIIENTENEKLPDIRTPQENEWAADQIVNLVRELCADENSQLHVSIAGGRKTMGFFMGYALSLYGRKQDSLSHVLVSEQFENLPSFFYPKPYSHIINNRDGKELDAMNASVMLAEIPWVRLGLGVPDSLLENKTSYSESVKNAQLLLDEPSLTFLAPMEDRIVCFGSKEVKLAPRGYAFLLSLILAKYQEAEFGVRNEAKTVELYLAVYHELSANDEKMQERLDPKFNALKEVLAESRNDLVKKIQATFSLGKGIKTPYIPSSKGSKYQLDIELEHIDLADIQPRLAELRLL